MGDKSGGLTPKAASQALLVAHLDRCAEDLIAIRSGQYVGPRTKGSVALLPPCFKTYASQRPK